MAQKYTDDVYEHIENELEQIQRCPGMYISTLGTEGALHLLKEIVSNSIDESNNVMSPCDTIYIFFDEDEQHFIVEDNGRGIPFDKMTEFSTKKHTGTKYNRANNYYSAGCFGVGTKVTNAFSKVYSITSYRDGKEKTVRFENGVPHEFEATRQRGKDEHYGGAYDMPLEHGLVTHFVPDPKWLGPFHVTEDMCLEWLKHMSYVISEKLTIQFYACKDDFNDVKYSRTFKHESLAENVKFLSPYKLEFEPISVSYSESEEPGSLFLDMSFSYDKLVEDEANDSYCNNVWTFGGGYHLNTCRSALCDFMVRAARKADPESKFPVTLADVRKGLIMVVNCLWGAVVLSGQHKSAVSSKEIDELGRKGINQAIADYFEKHPSTLNKLIAYYRQMSKIRLASLQLKNVKPPKEMSFYDEISIKRYIPLSDSNRKGYKELIITEGDSAAGAINKIIDHKYQAIYNTRGVFKNTTQLDTATMMKSEIPKELSQIMGVEPGKPFDVSHCKWNKIIFMQDADADGKNIRSISSSYYIMHYPGLIEEGRLYAGMPPLYVLSDATVKKFKTSKNFYYDKKEFQREVFDIISRNVDLWVYPEGLSKPEVKLTRREVLSFLEMNKGYYDAIVELASTKLACHPILVEIICYHIVKYGIGTKEFVDAVLKDFPEMKYDETNCSLYGAYNGEIYGLILDKEFLTFAKDFLPMVEENPSPYVSYNNKDAHDMSVYDMAPMTIGTFYNEINAHFNINAEQRFKGLGEASDKLMFLTSLNPKTRKLIRLTMEDREKVIDAVLKLHGKDPKYREARRQLLANADITYDDLDN